MTDETGQDEPGAPPVTEQPVDWEAVRVEAREAHMSAWSLNTAEREGWYDQAAHNNGMTEAVLAVLCRHLGIDLPPGGGDRG